MNYYERHIGDYLKDTAHLSLLEHGIYARPLDVYYTRECGLHPDDVARLIGARTKEEKDALRGVLNEFFTYDDGLYVQDRCEREIERYQRKAAHNREVGKLGGRPRKSETQPKPPGLFLGSEKGTQPEPKPNPPSNQTPVTNTPIAPKGAGTVHKFPPGFERFWEAYPRKVGKDAAAKAFARRKPDAALLESMLAAVAVQRQSEGWLKDGGQFIPNPSTWLNQGRWQDEIASRTSASEMFRERGL